MADTRARRRSALQETLRTAALRLFAERGYEATTVKDIAGAADVSERTFFRYYPSKSDVLLGDLNEIRRRLIDALGSRPASEPPLTAICAALVSLPPPAGTPGLAALLPMTGNALHRPEEAVGDWLPPTAPTARLLQMFADWEGSLVRALLIRAGSDDRPSRMRAEITARASLGAMRTAIQHHQELYQAGNHDPGLFHQLVVEAFAVLSP